MARWIGPSPEHDHIGAVLVAAEIWRDRCFLEDGSVFGDESLWTPENMAALSGKLEVDPLDGEGAKFLEKLERQLDGAGREVVQLAAEVLWFAYLFAWKAGLRPQTKRERITRVWGWSGANAIGESVYLSDQTLSGVGSPGFGFNDTSPHGDSLSHAGSRPVARSAARPENRSEGSRIAVGIRRLA